MQVNNFRFFYGAPLHHQLAVYGGVKRSETCPYCQHILIANIYPLHSSRRQKKVSININELALWPFDFDKTGCILYTVVWAFADGFIIRRYIENDPNNYLKISTLTQTEPVFVRPKRMKRTQQKPQKKWCNMCARLTCFSVRNTATLTGSLPDRRNQVHD